MILPPRWVYKLTLTEQSRVFDNSWFTETNKWLKIKDFHKLVQVLLPVIVLKELSLTVFRLTDSRPSGPGDIPLYCTIKWATDTNTWRETRFLEPKSRQVKLNYQGFTRGQEIWDFRWSWGSKEMVTLCILDSPKNWRLKHMVHVTYFPSYKYRKPK